MNYSKFYSIWNHAFLTTFSDTFTPRLRHRKAGLDKQFFLGWISILTGMCLLRFKPKNPKIYRYLKDRKDPFVPSFSSTDAFFPSALFNRYPLSSSPFQSRFSSSSKISYWLTVFFHVKSVKEKEKSPKIWIPWFFWLVQKKVCLKALLYINRRLGHEFWHSRIFKSPIGWFRIVPNYFHVRLRRLLKP